MTGARAAFLAVLVLGVGGCAGIHGGEYGVTLPRGLAEKVELLAVPFHPQEDHLCGPAALATLLGSAGIQRTPEDLKDQVYLPQRQGSLQPEMLAGARRAGLVPYVLAPRIEALLQEVAAGHPVLVLQNLHPAILKRWPQWHYAVVMGYDLTDQTVLLRSGGERRLLMTMADFDRTWAGAERWAFVALPPDRLPATARAAEFVSAAVALERSSPNAARRAYQTALAAWPENLLARLASGNAAYHLGQVDTARAEYRRATEDHPEAADAWNNLAQVLYETGHREEAQQAAKRAVDLGGSHLTAYQATLKMIETDARRIRKTHVE